MSKTLYLGPLGWRMDGQSGIDKGLSDVIFGFETLSVEDK
jgi:hypothetical protein